MKYLSCRIKKAAPLALLSLLLLDHSPVSQNAQALVGGPFDDNQYPGATADGTYSGTITGKNLIGMVAFGVSSSVESGGRFSVFHEGFVHYGAAAGQADIQSRRVFGSLLGVAALGGNGTGAGIVETTGGSGSAANAQTTITVRSSAEGAFIARMKGYPNYIVFEGEGKLATVANNAVLTGRAVNGGIIEEGTTVTVPSRSGTDFQQPDNAEGDEVVQLQVAQLRNTTPFKVRGSRVSRSAFIPTTSYASVPPIVPESPATPTPTATPVATPAP